MKSKTTLTAVVLVGLVAFAMIPAASALKTTAHATGWCYYAYHGDNDPDTGFYARSNGYASASASTTELLHDISASAATEGRLPDTDNGDWINGKYFVEAEVDRPSHQVDPGYIAWGEGLAKGSYWTPTAEDPYNRYAQEAHDYETETCEEADTGDNDSLACDDSTIWLSPNMMRNTIEQLQSTLCGDDDEESQ